VKQISGLGEYLLAETKKYNSMRKERETDIVIRYL
jgi:hypothetical protein